jgi:hypothetical protein
MMVNTLRQVYNETWEFRIHAQRNGEEPFIIDRIKHAHERVARNKLDARVQQLREENPDLTIWWCEDLLALHEY